jgi:hypothetical protein
MSTGRLATSSCSMTRTTCQGTSPSLTAVQATATPSSSALQTSAHLPSATTSGSRRSANTATGAAGGCLVLPTCWQHVWHMSTPSLAALLAYLFPALFLCRLCGGSRGSSHLVHGCFWPDTHTVRTFLPCGCCLADTCGAILIHGHLRRDPQSNQCKLQGQCQPPPPQCKDITDKDQCSSRSDCC